MAPGPANGFTLDLIDCFERFGALIDWAMVILNPLEPWPGELVLPAAREHDVRLITRVVDYGGLFWDDVRPGHAFAPRDHRGFRPAGWIEAGCERLERLRPIAERHGLTPMGLACQWNLAHEPVACVVPTLIQEPGAGARTIESKRDELAAVPARVLLDADEVAGDPGDRRQHRLHGPQGRLAAVRRASRSPTAGRWTASCASSPRAGPSTPSATSRPRPPDRRRAPQRSSSGSSSGSSSSSSSASSSSAGALVAPGWWRTSKRSMSSSRARSSSGTSSPSSTQSPPSAPLLEQLGVDLGRVVDDDQHLRLRVEVGPGTVDEVLEVEAAQGGHGPGFLHEPGARCHRDGRGLTCGPVPVGWEAR